MSTDGKKNGSLPAFGPIEAGPLPKGMDDVEPEDQKLDDPPMTDAELSQAVSDAGLVVISRKKIKGLAKVGKELKRAGMIDISRGRYAGRVDALERVRAVMLELVEERVQFTDNDPERPVVNQDVVIAAANTLVAVVLAENKTDETAINFEKTVAPKGPELAPRNQLPPSTTPLVAMQCSGNVTMVEAKQSDKI